MRQNNFSKNENSETNVFYIVCVIKRLKTFLISLFLTLQIFTFKSKNMADPQKFLDYLKQKCFSSELSNMTIKIENEVICANKFVLTRNEVFSKMLKIWTNLAIIFWKLLIVLLKHSKHIWNIYTSMNWLMIKKTLTN